MPGQRHPEHQKSYHSGLEPPFFEILQNRFLKILSYMPMFAGFQIMMILDPYGITFDAVGVWPGLSNFM